jgi:ribosomal-protein-alanine N-acetyltransferase
MPSLREPPVLTTARLTLRLAEPGDAEAIARYFVENHDHLASTRPRMEPSSLRRSSGARSRRRAAPSSARTARCASSVGERGTERVLASANFTQFVRGAAQYCVLGYGIAADREGRGFMQEGLEAAIAYVFDELNMHRIMANYFPWNRRSGALLRRLGFTVEGYAHDYLFLDGAWQDHILTSRINPAAPGVNGGPPPRSYLAAPPPTVPVY